MDGSVSGLDGNEWRQSAAVLHRTGVRMVAAVPQSWIDRADLCLLLWACLPSMAMYGKH